MARVLKSNCLSCDALAAAKFKNPFPVMRRGFTNIRPLRIRGKLRPAHLPLQNNGAGVLTFGLTENGSQNATLPALLQTHKKTELSESARLRISETFVESYQKGLSLADISRQTGKAKNTIRAALLRSGIALRPNKPLPVSKAVREPGKRNIRPYYGFCYFQGAITPDPREFENLVLIHRLWQSGTNPNRIADTLNDKKIPARCAATWNRNSIVNIIARFEAKKVVLTKGGKYELR